MISINYKIKVFIYFFLLFLLFIPKPAYAYLDPGTGSYLFQLVIAGLLGGIFFFRSSFTKIKEYFRNLLPDKKSPKTDEDK